MQVNKLNNSHTNKTFKGLESSKLLRGFVKSQEPSNLKYTRFCQDVATNWVPKAVLTRSLADLSEMTFLEFTESSLFYFVPEIFGKVFGKVLPKFHGNNSRKEVKSLLC